MKICNQLDCPLYDSKKKNSDFWEILKISNERLESAKHSEKMQLRYIHALITYCMKLSQNTLPHECSICKWKIVNHDSRAELLARRAKKELENSHE